jgi:hypothetical protein
VQRWKEQYFVNVGTDCGLTIAGFYYVCFSCSDGYISGFYYDPNSRYFAFLLVTPLPPHQNKKKKEKEKELIVEINLKQRAAHFRSWS